MTEEHGESRFFCWQNLKYEHDILLISNFSYNFKNIVIILNLLS